jgi:hypothetical protein
MPSNSSESGLDRMFRDTNIVVIILFGLCCGQIALILGIVGLALCKDPKAKQNATIVVAISVVNIVISIILFATGAFSTRIR